MPEIFQPLQRSFQAALAATMLTASSLTAQEAPKNTKDSATNGIITSAKATERSAAQSISQADPYVATLEASIKEASKKGIKDDYLQYLRQHPSPFFANVVLRLLIQNKIDLRAANLALYTAGGSIKLYKDDPKERMNTAAHHIAQLLNDLSLKTTQQTDSQINGVIKLLREQKHDEATKLLITILTGRGLL